MKTLRQKRGSSGALAAITLVGAYATTFGVAGEAAAQVATCEGGGYESSASGFSHSTSGGNGCSRNSNCHGSNGHNGKGDAQQSAKDSASAACSGYCAPLDACSDNKPNCMGTVSSVRMTCYLFCYGYPCVWICNASYTCTCGCSSNSAQGGVAGMNVLFDEADSDDVFADLVGVAVADASENPFGGSWDGTYELPDLGGGGTVEFRISKTGVLKGRSINEDGTGHTLVAHIDAEGWMNGVAIFDDGGVAEHYSGSCSINEGGDMVCDLIGCIQNDCFELVVIVAPV